MSRQRFQRKKKLHAKLRPQLKTQLQQKSRGWDNKLSRDKETGLRQPNEEAIKNSVVIDETRPRLYIVKNKTKKVATSK